jgi:hypothetical protein
MAHMVPPDEPRSVNSSERQLFKVLKQRLPDSYFVYHNLDYLDGEEAREGEADFLILHRERGLLALECKGKGVVCDRQRRWWRGNERLKQSPFKQAQGQIKALVKEIGKRYVKAFPDLRLPLPLVHGQAVAFPVAVVDELTLPLDVQREIVLDASDLESVEAWVERAFAFWRRARSGSLKPLNVKRFKQFRRVALHPSLHLVPTLGASLHAQAEALDRLSQEQVRVIDGLIDNRRQRVIGGAGTGKTVVALEAARLLALRGQRVLLCCFNRALADYLRGRLAAAETAPGSVDVWNFHALCAEAGRASSGRFEPPGRGTAEAPDFWNEQAPLTLLDALGKGKIEPWDSLVVDEGQDFAQNWWEVLVDGALRDLDAGTVLVCSDDAQDIFGRCSAVPDYPSVFKLTWNFRNARLIGETVRDLGGVAMRPHPRCPQGEAPTVFPGKCDPSEVEALVTRLVEQERVSPEQITILSPRSPANSSLGGVKKIAGIPVAHSSARREHMILHTSIGAFKGLESDVVILIDIDPTHKRCTVRDRYVAASRAKLMLYVFAQGDWLEGSEAER